MRAAGCELTGQFLQLKSMVRPFTKQKRKGGKKFANAGFNPFPIMTPPMFRIRGLILFSATLTRGLLVELLRPRRETMGGTAISSPTITQQSTPNPRNKVSGSP